MLCVEIIIKLFVSYGNHSPFNPQGPLWTTALTKNTVRIKYFWFNDILSCPCQFSQLFPTILTKSQFSQLFTVGNGPPRFSQLSQLSGNPEKGVLCMLHVQANPSPLPKKIWCCLYFFTLMNSSVSPYVIIQ